MYRNELLSISGLRSDGRKADEIRRIATSLGTYKGCDGSSYLEMGNTKVVSVVYGPIDNNTLGLATDQATVTCDVSIDSFSGSERKYFSKNHRMCEEISLAIQRCFEQVIMRDLYPSSTISIHCNVIQSDGGVMACCLNAALLALVDAGIPIIDFQMAVSVGYMDNMVLLDMNHNESKLNGICLTVAYLPKTDKFTLITMDNNIPIALFEEILTAAKEGCKQIYETLSEDVLDNAKTLYKKSSLMNE